MDRDTFEQLLSRWLDEPQRCELRARLTAAADASAELARLQAQWLRLAELLGRTAPPLESVDWARFRDRIAAAVAQAEADRALDPMLRALTEVQGQVDWRLLHRRTSGAVARARREGRSLGRLLARGGLWVAAAAALLLMLVVPPPKSRPTRGQVLVEVGGPPATWHAGGENSLVLVSVSAPPGHVSTGRPAPSAESAALAELFLMIEPKPAAATRTAAGFLEFN